MEKFTLFGKEIPLNPPVSIGHDVPATEIIITWLGDTNDPPLLFIDGYLYKKIES